LWLMNTVAESWHFPSSLGFCFKCRNSYREHVTTGRNLGQFLPSAEFKHLNPSDEQPTMDAQVGVGAKMQADSNASVFTAHKARNYLWHPRDLLYVLQRKQAPGYQSTGHLENYHVRSAAWNICISRLYHQGQKCSAAAKYCANASSEPIGACQILPG